uniref:site-specific DNA-methyltransferase (cytosine-N(4)-specific) n=1 Tax=viral metagenome TaxID=1070528 RepID=A0A6M3IKX6_9ZZZZ
MSFLGDEIIVEDAKGKTLESLAKSRKIRTAFISQYGMVPCSILANDKKQDKVVKSERRGYQDTAFTRRTGKKIQHLAFDVSGKGCGGGALSSFPQNVGRLVAQFYCPENGLVYDPFAGHNSRMELCHSLGFSYIGVDVSKTFMKYNREIQDKLLNDTGFLKPENTICLIEGSSASVPDVPSNFADFTITSPPYWDIEYYGDELEQLGNAKTYDKFLELLSPHVTENFRILKPGAFCCWFVNDFSKKNVFYPYHSDLIPMFRKAGFSLFNIYIVDLGRTIAECFVQDIIKKKRFPKRHEYCLVFTKP